MAYIPKELIKNPNNEKRLHEIMDFLEETDVFDEEWKLKRQAMIRELLEMEETEVYDKLIAKRT
jgi:hypothetical protein